MICEELLTLFDLVVGVGGKEMREGEFVSFQSDSLKQCGKMLGRGRMMDQVVMWGSGLCDQNVKRRWQGKADK